MQPNLNQIIKYQNANIITRYIKDYPATTMKPEEALQELMKFIWLCCKHKEDKRKFPDASFLNFSCVIHEEMRDIDNMWHTFLLFTKDYHEFCQTYLDGIFFHHHPISNTKETIFKESYELELNRYLSYIYDNLGKDTLIKWFG